MPAMKEHSRPNITGMARSYRAVTTERGNDVNNLTPEC